MLLKEMPLKFGPLPPPCLVPVPPLFWPQQLAPRASKVQVMLPLLTLHPLAPDNHCEGLVVGRGALKIKEFAVVVFKGAQRRNAQGRIEGLMAATPTLLKKLMMPMVMRPVTLWKRRWMTCTCTTSTFRMARYFCGKESMFDLCLRLG